MKRWIERRKDKGGGLMLIRIRVHTAARACQIVIFFSRRPLDMLEHQCNSLPLEQPA